jgi:hypothetical protein
MRWLDTIMEVTGIRLEVLKEAVQDKKIQFLPYGRSIGSWTCLTHKTYIRIRHQWWLAILNQFSVLIYAVCHILPFFRFLSRMRCISMGVWASMIY